MAFSEVDFKRMQSQLIELREASYKKDEHRKKQEREIEFLKERLGDLGKELEKANQTINKSKKAKEYDVLCQELQRMRMKKDVQEEEARMQNDELIKQLTEFVTANERLMEENERLKEKKDVVAMDEYKGLEDQLRRLHAQYTALQKCSKVTPSSKADATSSTCSDPVPHNGECSESNNNNNNNSNNGNNDNNNNSNNNNDHNHNEINNGNNDNASKCNDIETNNNNNNNNNNNSDISLAELRLQLETEKQENAMLKTQLLQASTKQKDEMERLKSEVEKLEEKLKKKQESYLSLQDSKDALLKDMHRRVAVEVEKVHSTGLEGRCEQLASETKMMEASLKVFKNKCHELEREKLALEGRLRGCQEELRSAREELRVAREDSKVQSRGVVEQKQLLIDEQMSLIEDMKTQNRESQSVHEKAVEEISVLRKEYEALNNKFNDVSKLAESRKQHLDTMAIKYNEVIDSSKDRLQQLTLTNQQQAHKYDLEIEALKNEVKEVRLLRGECQSLKRLLQEGAEAREEVEERLAKVERGKEEAEARHKQEVQSLKLQQEQQLQQQLQQHATQLKTHEDRLQQMQGKTEELQQALSLKDSMIRDHSEDKKLHEKKGSAVIKDLRRQLEAERRRSDKLQEKLQGVLLDTRGRQSVEDLFRPLEARQKPNDNSSLSSWSPSGASRDIFQGVDEEGEGGLKSENDELIKRVTQLQQDLCLNKEKVSHLEASNAAMAEDLLEKTAVIRHYHMHNRAGQVISNSSSHESMSFKRVLKLVGEQDKGDRHMNKKLQDIIEETLVKNMHLQNDVEVLTKELASLKASGL